MTTMPRARMRYHVNIGFVASALVLLFAVAGCAGATSPTSPHATPRRDGAKGEINGKAIQLGGDPGGEILAALTRVQEAVPMGATGVSRTVMRSSWIGSCDDEHFKKGWGPVGVTIVFKSASSNSATLAEVSRWMAGHGWHVSQTKDGGPPGKTVPIWSRALSQGVVATAVLMYGANGFPADINVTSPPEPPKGECAGG
jgi:hypothetical protein